MLLQDYILDHISPEHPYLYRLYRATNIKLLRPRMASGHMQGQLLKMLCQMVQPRNVLEIGTYSGYSAMAMASGMPEGSRLYTFEINDEQEDFTRPWIEGSPWADRIEMIIGDVSQLLPGLATQIAQQAHGQAEQLCDQASQPHDQASQPSDQASQPHDQASQPCEVFDLAFIDANKRDYCDYYHLVMPHLRPGGWLLADNTLWDGHVVDPAYERDAQTRGIKAFNDLVRSEAEAGRIELNILPLRDGLTLIRKAPAL